MDFSQLNNPNHQILKIPLKKINQNNEKTIAESID